MTFSNLPVVNNLFISPEFYRTFGRLYQRYRSEGVFRLWMGPRQVVYVLTDVQSIEVNSLMSSNLFKN